MQKKLHFVLACRRYFVDAASHSPAAAWPSPKFQPSSNPMAANPDPSVCPAPPRNCDRSSRSDGPVRSPRLSQSSRSSRSQLAAPLCLLPVLLALLLLGGCGSTGDQSTGYHVASDAVGEPSYAPALRTLRIGGSAIGAFMPAAPPTPSDRPGLATRAGHRQSSTVNTVAFYRKGSTPDAIDTFHYNDERGAEAMIDLAGGGRRRSGLFPAANQLLRVGLEDRRRSVLPRYETDGRRVVIGQSGQAYVIVLENRSSQRQEVVVSVDGLDVMTGRAASLSGRGYVIEPGATLRIRGFREDSSSVREFRFGSVADSAAAARGQAANVGVIGLAVFAEDEAAAREAQRQEQARRDRASAFGQ